MKHKTVSEQMVTECVDMDKITQALLQTSAFQKIYNASNVNG